MIETSSVPPRKSSEIFVNLRKIFENVRKRSPYLRNNFGKSSEIFGKWSEIFGKSSKTSSLVCLCNKQNITCPLVDMNFIFSCSTRHLTSERSERVRYRVEHSKTKFISTRGHVISSISSSFLMWKNTRNVSVNNKMSAVLNTCSKGNIDRSKCALAATDKKCVYILRSKCGKTPEMFL